MSEIMESPLIALPGSLNTRQCLAPALLTTLVATELFWRSGFNNEKLLETGAICMRGHYYRVLFLLLYFSRLH